MIKITIQEEDFSQGSEYQHLAQGNDAGAVVTFVGRVRDFTAKPNQTMWLEHYPGMTEKSLDTIARNATARWPIHGTTIIHRIGELHPGDQIVFVGVSSAHRKAAFEACEYIMDYLKMDAPFWKKEGGSWVEAKCSDKEQLQKWAATNTDE